MSVLDRRALEASPLADLHAIASELSIDGYRRLRRAELIDAILATQDGREPSPVAAEPPAKPTEDAANGAGAKAAEEEDEEPTGGRRRRGRRGGRGRAAAGRESGESTAQEEAASEAEEPEAEPEPSSSEELVEGVVELLANGSGFVRVDPPDPSDQDVYISSAQVKRCELVSGDRVAGPKRAPRRSERFASLIRIETINERPASELADSVRFDDLPCAFPSDRIKLDADDPTLKAMELLAPFGKGSRVTITGPARSGKSEALRRIAQALAGRDDLTVTVVLAGVRPEETRDWNDAELPVGPTPAVSFAASEDARNAAIEPAIDQARRLAARGADAVVLIDTLDGCSLQLARKAMAASRNIVDGGSLTVIATASEPIGAETTVISLDVALTSLGRFPALDPLASGTMRAELLVGEAGAEAIVSSRAHAAEGGGDPQLPGAGGRGRRR
ncbi:MAG TPA: Rho termination factor N-terminal domain-containing protein [Solirubrobacteraceae bacterium]|jgi:transcription termination factor Rho|nr:Rho termination factor N-terminal domain-containing protein [Solirubrobacteraceae bacterium]